jgi:plastocyanin
MRQLARPFAILAAGALVIACGGGSPTAAPVTGAPVTGVPGTVAPATAAATTSGAVAACHAPDAGMATTVETAVAGFEWSPVTAKVGDVITWTNGDNVPHGVKTDDGGCRMAENIPGGGTGSLVFDTAGTFPFTCTVHGNMKSTITITE